MKDGYVPQSYMQIKKKFYTPKDIGFEKKIKARLEEHQKLSEENKQ